MYYIYVENNLRRHNTHRYNMTRLMKQQAGGSKQRRGQIIMFVLMILGLIELLLNILIIPNSEDVSVDVSPQSTRVANYSSYRHDNLILQAEKECTKQQREKINIQLKLESGNVRVKGCNNPTSWLDSFFEEEADIGTESFLGISVGCNKVCVCSSSPVGCLSSLFKRISNYFNIFPPPSSGNRRHPNGKTGNERS